MSLDRANAYALIMAFPDFYTFPDGGWHIWVCKKLGLIKQGLVPGGHAAMAFIHKETGQIEYADLGRYTSPKGKARLRTRNTDPDLTIDLKAEFDSEGNLLNKAEILRYFDDRRDLVQSIGAMYASFCSKINYEEAKAYMAYLESLGNVSYNVFGKENINCARFVRRALLKSVVDKSIYRKLKYTVEPSPCPLGNAILGASPSELFRIWQGEITLEKRSLVRLMAKYFFSNSPNEHNIKYTSPNGEFDPPSQPVEFPDAQWLGGFGGGAWFNLEKPAHLSDQSLYRIRQINKKNKVVFDYLFEVDDLSFDINQPFEVTYDSTALFCTVIQGDKYYIFDYKMQYSDSMVY